MAIIAVSHLRKGEEPAMYRVMESLTFVASARTARTVAKGPEDPTGRRRPFLPIKNSLAEDVTGLAYTIKSSASCSTPHVVCESEPIAVSADDVIGRARRHGGGEAVEEAKDWLLTVLADGPVLAKNVESRAQEDGIKPQTLDREKAALIVIASPDKFQGPWM